MVILWWPRNEALRGGSRLCHEGRRGEAFPDTWPASFSSTVERMRAVMMGRLRACGQSPSNLAAMKECLIDVDACVGAHHLSRKLKVAGHDGRLMPAKYVRPYSKVQKNDFRDAEAIAEAVHRLTMKFAAAKAAKQLDLQALHRVRERLVSQRRGAPVTETEAAA